MDAGTIGLLFVVQHVFLFNATNLIIRLKYYDYIREAKHKNTVITSGMH